MVPNICSFSDCGRPIKARELCVGHYAQQGRGKPLAPLKGRALTTGMTDEQRFWHYVKKTGTCWEWSAGLNVNGYGMVKFGGRQALAHRIAWELQRGPLPTGHELDHMCHNPSCVNPQHMQAVDHKVNAENRRGAQRNSQSGVRGVTPHGNRWQAQVVHHSRAVYAGRFSSIAEAEAAVIAKRNELFTNNLRDRKVA